MYIYRIYNVLTNESYIGQTTKTIDYRFKEHVREAKSALRGEKRNFPYFHRLLLHYGPENFKIELLEEVADNKADEREIYWIEYYDSYYNGYNSTKGGQARPIIDLNKEANYKWKENPNKNHTNGGGMSIEKVISAGLYNPKGNLNAGKPVAQYSLEDELIEIYPAASVASKETGISATGIRNVCNGKQKKSGGFIWKWAD